MLSRPAPGPDVPRRPPGRGLLIFRTSLDGEVVEDMDEFGSSKECGDDPVDGNKLYVEDGDVGIEFIAAEVASGSFPARARLFSSSPPTVRML